MRTFKAQRGFFDFGVGFALLAIFGSTAATIDSNKVEATSYVQQRAITAPSEVPDKIAVVQAGSE